MSPHHQTAILQLLQAKGPLCVGSIRSQLNMTQIAAAKSIRRLVDRGVVRISADKVQANALIELMQR